MLHGNPLQPTEPPHGASIEGPTRFTSIPMASFADTAQDLSSASIFSEA